MKSYFVKSIFCAAILAAGAAQAQSESTGHIQLTGNIFSSTCEVEINGNSNNGNATVPMGSYSTEAFAKKGDEVGGEGKNGKIQFNLSRCPEDKKEVSLKLNADMYDEWVVKLDNAGASSTAKNIGIFIYGADDLYMPLDLTKSYNYPIDEVSNTVDIDLVATYVSLDDVVSAGNANASLNYSITYN